MAKETTSKRVATIAGKVLSRFDTVRCEEREAVGVGGMQADGGLKLIPICSVSELKALAASCLNQAADKGKKEKVKAG